MSCLSSDLVVKVERGFYLAAPGKLGSSPSEISRVVSAISSRAPDWLIQIKLADIILRPNHRDVPNPPSKQAGSATTNGVDGLPKGRNCGSQRVDVA